MSTLQFSQELLSPAGVFRSIGLFFPRETVTQLTRSYSTDCNQRDPCDLPTSALSPLLSDDDQSPKKVWRLGTEREALSGRTSPPCLDDDEVEETLAVGVHDDDDDSPADDADHLGVVGEGLDLGVAPQINNVTTLRCWQNLTRTMGNI